ncbi:MAG: Sf3a2-prov protein [Rhizobiaceae bacterium]|nr:Sf3a2-prov protein [Rhizobiaceae bacterium]
MEKEIAPIPPLVPDMGLPNPIQPQLPDMPDFTGIEKPKGSGSDDVEIEAYERGVAAGKRENEAEHNPYPDGSDEAKAFEHGYLDGQKIRSDDRSPI